MISFSKSQVKHRGTEQLARRWRRAATVALHTNRSVELAKLAVTNQIGMLKCDRQKVCPITVLFGKVLP